MTMPAVSTTPPTTISLAAIVFAVSRHVTKSAAHDTNRQLMAFDNTLAMMKRAVVLLSGGIDSTTALAVARQRGFETFALSFRYGQRHAAEVEAARCVARALGAARHEVIAIDLRAFGGSAIIAEGTALGVDFSLTLSCYDPTPDGAACGRCDACLLRRKGFEHAGVADPTRYRAG